MKKIILTILLILIPILIFSAKVPKNKAEKIAKNFLNETTFTTDIMKDNIYVFGTDHSFILLSNDDNCEPILGYSYESAYSEEPPQFKAMLSNFSQQIEYIVDNNLEYQPIKDKWDNLLQNNFIESKSSVDPLLTCEWDQGTYYNALCPVDVDGPDGHVYTGCVANAMAMIMYYYRYPNQGQGMHGYASNYGYLHIDFSKYFYNWNAMLNSLSTYNDEIAKLQYHCGVAVNMNYSPNGSGAQSSRAVNALKNYFKYSTTLQLIYKSNYTNTQWQNILTDNLNNGMPLYYHGFGYGDEPGHAFVCDGYENDKFHFNWGWGGVANGYFYLNNLNPYGSNFTNGQGAIINIYPIDSNYPYYCSTLNNLTSISGTFEDGSGPDTYLSNSSCEWLIEPNDPNHDSVSGIILKFNKFDTENIYDVVNIYDGATKLSPLLGSFSGDAIPNTITSTSDKILVTFNTNSSNNKTGWFATYESILPDYCSQEILTDTSGTFSDGSGIKNYSNNSLCSWSIQVQNAGLITIGFTNFDIEPTHDFIKIYDPTKTPSKLIATYSGSNIPPETQVYSNSAFVQFFTNDDIVSGGWDAYYYSSMVGINELNEKNIKIYPNPSNDIINIDGVENVEIKLYSVNGKLLYTNINVNKIDMSNFQKGIYILKIGEINKKIVKY